jgi:cysteinyl-tRNA synthetase
MRILVMQGTNSLITLYRTYICLDVLRRILNHNGIQVIQVMNITDIDDKIIKKCQEQKMMPRDLAIKYEDSFRKDMDALNVLPCTLYTRVSDFLPQMIQFIQKLVSSEQAYVTPRGNVYFDSLSFRENYSPNVFFRHENSENLNTDDKRHPCDFVLWKCTQEDAIYTWDSPWSKGRPGWHLECSSMNR